MGFKNNLFVIGCCSYFIDLIIYINGFGYFYGEVVYYINIDWSIFFGS